MTNNNNNNNRNGILWNRDFIERAARSEQILRELDNADTQDAIITGYREGNTITDEGTFARDILTGSYLDLERRYGRNVAERQQELAQRYTEFENELNPDNGFILDTADNALGFVNNAQSSVAGLLGLASQASPVFETLDNPDLARAQVSTNIAEGSQQVSDFLTSMQSEERRARDRLIEIDAMLDREDNAALREQDISERRGELISAFREQGRNILDTFERVGDNPSWAIDQGIESLGSLVTSVPIARASGALSSNIARSITRNGISETNEQLARTLGVAGGVGAVEASSVYTEVQNTVMGLSEEDLMRGSESYRELIDEGMDPQDARTIIAAATGAEAFALQLPVAAAVGLIASRFESAPIGTFMGGNLLSAARTIASQGIEEFLQEGSGTIAGNIAVQQNALEDQDWLEGSGEAAVIGAVSGLGMAGITGVPGIAVNTGRDSLNAINSIMEVTEPQRKIVADVVRTGVGRIDTATQGVRENLTNVANMATTRIDAYRERIQDTDVQESIDNLQQIENNFNEILQSEQVTDLSFSILNQFVEPTNVPERFRDVVVSDNLIQNITGIVSRVGFRNSDLTNEDYVYAARQIQDLINVADTLPETTRRNIVKFTQNKITKQILEKGNVDLNVEPTTDVQTVVNIARRTPTNMNPEIATQILQQSDELVNPEDIEYVRTASQVASVLNRHADTKINIRKEENIGLENNNKKPKEELKTRQEQAGYSIRAKGYVDKRGNKLRSVNDFANDIIVGMQTENKTVFNERTGNFEPVQNVIGEFTNFVNHLNRKVDALNKSLKNSYLNKVGNVVGPATTFEGVVEGKYVVPAADWKNPVRYNAGSPSSIAFAKEVQADRDAALDVINVLKNSFPEVFSDGLIENRVQLLTPEEVNLPSKDQFINTDGEINLVDNQDTRELNNEFENNTNIETTNNSENYQEIEIVDSIYDNEITNNIRLTSEQILNEQLKLGEKGNIGGVNVINDIEGKIQTVKDVTNSILQGATESPRQVTREQQIMADYLFEVLNKEISNNNVNTLTEVFKELEQNSSNSDQNKKTNLNNVIKDMAANVILEALENVSLEFKESFLRNELPELIRTEIISEETANTLYANNTNIEPNSQTNDEVSLRETEEQKQTNKNNKSVIRQNKISRQNVKNNPNILYVFGDNDQRKGLKGQAKEMRGEPNAVGIRTKKAPNNLESSFYTDDELSENIRKIDEDFSVLFDSDQNVVISTDSLGTGLSRLKELAPKTLKHIELRIRELEQNLPMSDVFNNNNNTFQETEQNQFIDSETNDFELIKDENKNKKKTIEIIQNIVKDIFKPKDKPPVFESLEDFAIKMREIEKVNQNLVEFVLNTAEEFANTMNDRLQDKIKSGGKIQSILDHIKEGKINFTNFKAGYFVNTETGEYIPEVLDMLSIVMGDFIATASNGDRKNLEDTLEKDSISILDIKKEDILRIQYGLSVSQVKNQLAKDFLRLLNVDIDPNARQADVIGISEGMAVEMLTALERMGFISLEQYELLNTETGKYNKVNTIMVNTDRMLDAQKQIRSFKGFGIKNTTKEALFNEARQSYSIGEPINTVDATGSRSGNNKLSKLERNAIKNIQDVPHYVNFRNVNIFEQFDADALARMFGFKEIDTIQNIELEKAQLGKNMSVMMMINDANEIIEAVETNVSNDLDNLAIYYPVGITSVGRHQMKGINPQNNKLLRMLATPTWSEIYLNDAESMSNFWNVVAQAADLIKTEKFLPLFVQNNVQDMFNAKYREATDILKNYIKSNSFDSNAFVDSVLDGESEIEPQIVSAIIAVAEMEVAKEKGQSVFRTSLSYELDGITNGAANMMINFGYGLMKNKTFENFNKVGYFLNSTSNTTLNSYYQGKTKTDLYEEVADTGQNMSRNLDETTKAVMRLFAQFGDLKLDSVTGEPMLVRNSAKNPMTKVNYGSGVLGVSAGLVKDMFIEFYNQIQNINPNTNWDTYFYKGILDDFNQIGLNINTKNINPRFMFNNLDKQYFVNVVKKTLGKILTESTKNVLGEEISDLNTLLVLSSNIQAEYMNRIYNKILEDAAEEYAKQGLVDRNKKTGKANIGQLPVKVFQEAEREASKFAPMFTSEDQTLAIGGMKNQPSDFRMSSTYDGKLAAPSYMRTPVEAGVKILPYSIIGSGDAMMINILFGQDNAPKDMIPIFDGTDIPVDKIQQYGEQVNQAVLKSWERDVLGMVISSYQNFINNADSNIYESVFAAMSKTIDSKLLKRMGATNANNLLKTLNDIHIDNQARKNVFKRLGISVDQMGGSNVGYQKEGLSLSRSEINQAIQEEMNTLRNKKSNKTETKTEIVISNVSDVVDISGMNGIQKRVFKLIQNNIKDINVVFGTLDQLNKWRQENVVDDGVVLNAQGQYDATNNLIFMTTKNPDTIMHEIIHAATYNKTLDYFNNKKTLKESELDAFSRLVYLQDEFLNTEFDEQLALQAQNSILIHLSKNTPEGNAAALNEFMAYSLGNTEVTKALNKKQTSLINELSNRVIELMKRILGSTKIPQSMLSHVVFNIEVIMSNNDINNEPINTDTNDSNSNNNNNNDRDNNNITLEIGKNFNYWVDQLGKHIDEISENKKADIETQLRTAKSRAKIDRSMANANKSVNNLREVGLLPTPEAQQIYKAIYMIMLSDMKLNPQAVLGLSNVFDHIESNMTPEMFGSDRLAQERYTTIMNAFGQYKTGDISDAVSVMFALSQTSKTFRDVIDQIPAPENETNTQGSLNQFLTATTAFTLRNIGGTLKDTNTDSENIAIIANTLIENAHEREFLVASRITSSFDVIDKFTSGMLSKFSNYARNKDVEIRASDKSKFVKTITGIITSVTDYLDEDNAQRRSEYIKDQFHMGYPLLNITPIREFVAEMVGTDSINSKIIQLTDQVNRDVALERESYRQDLPVQIVNLFNDTLENEQWSDMMEVLAYTDFQSLVDLNNMQYSMQLLSDSQTRQDAINKEIKEIQKLVNQNQFQELNDSALQLARYMIKGEPGVMLARNALSIAYKIEMDDTDSNKFNRLLTSTDKLISLYAINELNSQTKESVISLYENNQKGFHAIIGLLKKLQNEENNKVYVSTEARLNALKGYIPNESSNQTSIIVDRDANELYRKRQGYYKLQPYEDNEANDYPMSYYVSYVPQNHIYSQGAIQNVANTYNGIDVQKGINVSGDTSGFFTGIETVNIQKRITDSNYVPNNSQQGYLPVLNEKGQIIGFELVLSKDIKDLHLRREQHLPKMLGAWAGRQVEEKNSTQYNYAIIDILNDIYEKRKPTEDALYINLKDSDDPIHQENYKLLPQYLKDYIDTVYSDEGFWVRKDMVNMSVGYREPSVRDMWTGNSRLPKILQSSVTTLTEAVLGQNAMKILAKSEELWQSGVSTAKDIIVIRSLIIPAFNMKSNVIQLANRGVPLKQIYKGIRAKLAEVEKYRTNLARINKLKMELVLYTNNSNKKRIIEGKIQNIIDTNNRMSIAPMIEAGAYKQLNEGLTELDSSLTNGHLGDYIEELADKLPNGISNIAHVGLVSKSTKIYKAANIATQYSDFIAKSIFYDNLIANGLSEADALIQMNEEFINWTYLPGRTRSALEAYGLTWFMAFKIRVMKIAMKQLRQNPVRSLAVNSMLPGVGNPITDNLATVALDENRLDYATGFEMLFDAPSLNPWYNLMSN